MKLRQSLILKTCFQRGLQAFTPARMAQKLSAELGLVVGISSGANLIAALKLTRQYQNDEIMTIFCDDNKKFLTTDLTKIELIKPNYLSSDVELLEYAVIEA